MIPILPFDGLEGGKVMKQLDFINILMNTIPNPIFYKDEKGFYRHCNSAFLEFLGKKKEEVIGATVYDINPKECADVFHAADITLLESKGTQTYESDVMHRDGTLHRVIFSKAVVLGDDGRAIGIVGTISDISERKKTEKRLERLMKLKDALLEVNQAVIGLGDINKLYELILDKVMDCMENVDLSCIMVMDAEETLTIAACRGYDAEKAKQFRLKLRDSFVWRDRQSNLGKTVIINDIQKLAEKCQTKILDNKLDVEVESSLSSPIVIEGKLFGLFNVDSRYNHVYDKTDLDIMEYLRNQISIAINKHKLYEQTIYLSRYDKLTNSYNRSYFEELAEEMVEKASEGGRSLSLVSFDLDGLKRVNDSFGHLAGDALIRKFVENLRCCLNPEDLLARFGGDEFITLCPGVPPEDIAERLEALAANFAAYPMQIGESNIHCSFSYGIAVFPEDSRSYEGLVKTADERMYSYKARKRK